MQKVEIGKLFGGAKGREDWEEAPTGLGKGYEREQMKTLNGIIAKIEPIHRQLNKNGNGKQKKRKQTNDTKMSAH